MNPSPSPRSRAQLTSTWGREECFNMREMTKQKWDVKVESLNFTSISFQNTPSQLIEFPYWLKPKKE